MSLEALERIADQPDVDLIREKLAALAGEFSFSDGSQRLFLPCFGRLKPRVRALTFFLLRSRLGRLGDLAVLAELAVENLGHAQA